MLNKSYIRRNHRRVSLFILLYIQRKKRNETAKASFSRGERERDNKKGRRKCRKRMCTPAEQSCVSLRITHKRRHADNEPGKGKTNTRQCEQTFIQVKISLNLQNQQAHVTDVQMFIFHQIQFYCSYFVVIFYVFAPIFVFNSGSFYFGSSYIHFVTFDISMTSLPAILHRSPHSVFGSREER